MRQKQEAGKLYFSSSRDEQAVDSMLTDGNLALAKKAETEAAPKKK
jgi:hypothetical protein